MRKDLVIALLSMGLAFCLLELWLGEERVHDLTADALLNDPVRYDDKLVAVEGVLYADAALLCAAPTKLASYHHRPPHCIELYDDVLDAPAFEGKRVRVTGRFYFDACHFDYWTGRLKFYDPRLHQRWEIRRQTPRCFIDDKRLTQADYDRLPPEEQAKQSRPPQKFFPDMELSVRMIEALD